MKNSVSYGWQEETIEAKAKWFQSLSLEERMDLLCGFTEFALEINPQLTDVKNAQYTSTSVLVLSVPRG